MFLKLFWVIAQTQPQKHSQQLYGDFKTQYLQWFSKFSTYGHVSTKKTQNTKPKLEQLSYENTMNYLANIWNCIISPEFYTSLTLS